MKRTRHLSIATCFLVILFFAADLIAQPLWKQTNGAVGDPVVAMACDSNGGLYAASEHNLFYTSDQGSHWKNLTGGFTHMTINDIAIRKTGEIMVSTGGYYDWPRMGIVMISSDQGDSWSTVSREGWVMSNGINAAVDAGVAVDTANRYLFTANGIFYASSDGVTWDSVIYTTLLPGGTVPSRILVSKTGTLLIVNASEPPTLYRSVDQGKSWGKVINGLDWEQRIAWVADSTNGVIYMCGAQNWRRSIDNGRSWTAAGTTKLGAFAADPNGNVLRAWGVGYALNSEPERKSDFNEISPTIVTVGPDGTFYTGFKCGIMAVKAGDPATEKYIQLPAGSPIALVVHDGDRVISSTQLTGSGYYGSNLSYTIDGGNTWNLYSKPPFSFLKLALDSSGYVLASGNGGGYGALSHLCSSGDSGKSWNIGPGISPIISDICTSPSGSTFASSPTEGVFRTTDHGATWDQVVSGLVSQNVDALSVNASGEMFTATPEGVSHSTNDGATWSFLSQPAAGKNAHMVVTIAGDIIVSLDSAGVFISQDNGSTWSAIGTGLPYAKKINALLSTPIGHVFAATDSGLYYLPLAGGAWVSANSGLSGQYVQSLARSKEGTVYAGIAYCGVFRSTQTYNAAHAASVKMYSDRDGFQLAAPMPNPANGEVSLSFASKDLGRISIVNELGQELRHINLTEHTGRAKLQTQDLANGHYHVILRLAKEVRSMPLVVAH